MMKLLSHLGLLIRGLNNRGNCSGSTTPESFATNSFTKLFTLGKSKTRGSFQKCERCTQKEKAGPWKCTKHSNCGSTKCSGGLQLLSQGRHLWPDPTSQLKAHREGKSDQVSYRSMLKCRARYCSRPLNLQILLCNLNTFQTVLLRSNRVPILLELCLVTSWQRLHPIHQSSPVTIDSPNFFLHWHCNTTS